jgi:hypothetical protein
MNLAGPIDIDFNRLGKVLDLDIKAPDGTLIPMEFPSVDDVTQFGGNLTLGVGTFAEISGSFGIEKKTENGVTKVLVGGTNISAFVGDDSDANHFNGNEKGVQLSNGTLGVAVYKNGSNVDFAVSATGSVALAGIDGFTLSGTASVEVNNTGRTISETITTPGGTVALSFADDVARQRVAGTVTLSASGFATGSGAFAITKTPGELTIGATNVSAFVGTGTGANAVGVQLSGGKLGAVIATSGDNAGKYALEAGGTVSLVGVPLLTLSGTMDLELQRMGAVVNRTIATPGGDVSLNFGATDVTRLTGTAQFAVEGFVDIKENNT